MRMRGWEMEEGEGDIYDPPSSIFATPLSLFPNSKKGYYSEKKSTGQETDLMTKAKRVLATRNI